jgi:hypothetical protein
LASQLLEWKLKYYIIAPQYREPWVVYLDEKINLYIYDLYSKTIIKINEK